MNNPHGYFPPSAAPVRTPGVVTTVRVLLYILGGVAVLMTVANLTTVATTTQQVGAILAVEFPGLAALVLAIVLKPRRPAVRWLITADAICYILLALSVLGHGSPLGLPQLILPTLILLFTHQPPAPTYFHR